MKYAVVLTVCITFMICSPIFLMEKSNAMEKNNELAIIRLPEPVKDGSISVEQALKNRRSTRTFSEKPLTLQDIAQLLWAAQGTTGDRGFRTAPSAGALYPLEIYVAAGNVEKLPPGLYHYRSESHDLEIVARGDHRVSIYEAALNQDGIRNAPALFLFTGVFPRSLNKYGRRGLQYVLMETGHAAQNLLLQAEAMGLGHFPIGAFNDDQMREIINIDENTHPLYVIPVGHK